jgi:high-affinity nickel permease
MSLMDTTDRVLMTRAYGWAFVNPICKLWYDLTITAASVVVANSIGGVETLGLIGSKLGLQGVFWRVIGDLNHNHANFGYASLASSSPVGLFRRWCTVQKVMTILGPKDRRRRFARRGSLR